MKRLLAVGTLVVSTLVHADAPTPQDFARGLTLQPQAGKSVQQLRLPDAVYSAVLRADLGDIRIFNADGVVVPHALCPPAGAGSPSIGRRNLPLFVLRDTVTERNDGIRVEIDTAKGTRVRVLAPVAADQPAKSKAEPGNRNAYILDARGLTGRLRAIRIHWQASDSASEIDVRVQASTNLQDWRTIVSDASLLKATGMTGELEKNRIALPPAEYQYLRLEREGGGRLPGINRIEAEFSQPQAYSDARMVQARAEGPHNDNDAFLYDSRRLAPMQRASVGLPAENMSLVVALDSRAGPDARWQRRWRGEVYSLAGVSRPGHWRPIQFPTTSDRYWRLRVLQGADSLAGRQPDLHLSYTPRRLRFLAQGNPPYLLAFGSARVEPAAQDCDRLLGAVSGKRLHEVTGQARADKSLTRLGGDKVLSEPADPLPVARYVLWAVLILGVVALVGMAVSLLRRLRN